MSILQINKIYGLGNAHGESLYLQWDPKRDNVVKFTEVASRRLFATILQFCFNVTCLEMYPITC